MSDETKRDLEGEIEDLVRRLDRAYELNGFYRRNNLILERGLERQRRTWEKTAEHLRNERGKRRYAEEDARFLRSELRRWDDRFFSDGGQTPLHYAGDGVVTAAQALRAATAQPTTTPRSETAYYWWALAFKYLWRLWTKGQAPSDLRKCRDCLDRLEREVGNGNDEA